MTELAKLAWPDVAALLEKGCSAILPVGATEAHGPHLPLDTDVTIALGMARRACRQLEEKGRACIVLPAISYGVAEYADPFAGTLSLPESTATSYLRDILLAAVKTGFSPVAVANAHLEPAHIATINQAIGDVKSSSGTKVVFPDITRRHFAERLSEEFQSGACHAGQYESSLVLSDDPTAVREDKREQLPPVDISLVDAIRAGQKNFIEAGGDMAYFGQPAEASAEEGAATFQILAGILVESIEDQISSND